MRNKSPRPELIHIAGEGFIPLQILDSNEMFYFVRIFERDSAQPPHSRAALVELGKSMKAPAGDNPDIFSDIFSGFVYLAQFVNHDITFDWTCGLSFKISDKEKAQGRYPNLNLSSMYGGGPSYYRQLGEYNFYEDDGIRLRLGKTTGRDQFGLDKKLVYDNDLPRRTDNKQAIVPNPLNDENLILAQTHVAFIKFHNSVVDYLENEMKVPQVELFTEARKIVVQHYQSIVLYDLLPQLVDNDMHRQLMEGGRKIFFTDKSEGDLPGLPIEFVYAAFRFGHSMVRDTYEWNLIFNSNGRARYGVSLYALFQLAKISDNLGPVATLPSDWVVDWRRFYDFKGRKNKPTGQQNFARLIGTNLARQLHNLPEFVAVEEEDLRSLAVRDLLRGQAVRLPTGEAIADKMIDMGLPVVKLNLEQITFYPQVSNNQTDILKKQEFNFAGCTPLWYYILREAVVENQGKKLGKVGSYIVAETLHALIGGSDDSILKVSDWKPDPNLQPNNPNHYTMVDLLCFVDRASKQKDYRDKKVDEVNPLGDI